MKVEKVVGCGIRLEVNKRNGREDEDPTRGVLRAQAFSLEQLILHWEGSGLYICAFMKTRKTISLSKLFMHIASCDYFQTISPHFYQYLVSEVKNKVRIGIVGGSDLVKILEQLGNGEKGTSREFCCGYYHLVQIVITCSMSSAHNIYHGAYIIMFF